jgi:hypothetical protein
LERKYERGSWKSELTEGREIGENSYRDCHQKELISKHQIISLLDDVVPGSREDYGKYGVMSEDGTSLQAHHMQITILMEVVLVVVVVVSELKPARCWL